MRVITWNRSFRGLGLPHAESERNEADLEDYETLAIVLDKMLAWEKKLFEEVKVSFINFCISYYLWISFVFGFFMLHFRVPISDYIHYKSNHGNFNFLA